MWTLRPSTLYLALAVAGIAIIAALSGSHRVIAQSGQGRLGLPEDWSHRHVIFSNTRDIPLLLKIRQDPRILHQWLKQNVSGPNSGSRVPVEQLQFRTKEPDSDSNDRSVSQDHVDWSISLGGGNSIMPRTKYPAKYSFDINATPSCTNDFTIFSTGRIGNAGQATLVGFNNLYSTQGAAGGFCNHNGPSVKWAYNTGSVIMTSPVISLDGTKVAFVSRAPGTVHVLTLGTTGGNGASAITPVVPGTGNNAVDVRVALNAGHLVSSSSLFVDYGSDVGYVGDDNGVLHKITGVFTGTPSEVTTGGWPLTVSLGAARLNDPVFDFVSKNIFVTDAAGNLSYVREVGNASGACASGAPPCRGFPSVAVSSGSAIVDSPVVDYVTGRVFSETAANGANAQIIQTDTALGSVVRVNVGLQNAANPLHNGAFDSNYLNNVSTGFYYVCGKANNATLDPTLYRIGFNAAGVMNSAPGAATFRLGRAAGQCSPITQLLNTGSGKQWLFVSVSTRCGGTALIGGGCIMSFDTTSGMPAAATASVLQRNGTSGIIIDNVSTVAQASSIYFTNEGTGPCGDGIATGGCATKLTQAGLQ
ncbi:MAG: hypothetical protein JWO71_3710 [Candidatus Acidoferrum typicum]|nr:hypothetical protein [Candidatus Acidoferrum typicum]